MDPFSPFYVMLLDACGTLGISLPEDFRARIAAFHDLVIQANTRLNLTRITDPEGFLFKHVLDSLALLPHLEKPFDSLCDIGSGAGVPGVILALARPVSRLVLVERTGKKAKFLEETLSSLGLDGEVIAQNSPEYKPEELFDLVTVRAAGKPEAAIKSAAHLVAREGILALYQGPSLDEQMDAVLTAAKGKGLSGHRVTKFELPKVGARRLLLLRR